MLSALFLRTLLPRKEEKPEISPLLSHPLLFSTFSIFLVLLLAKWLFTAPRPSKILPPSPWKLPLIGNIHHLGLLPHRSLQSRARKHGPIMLLHFGRVPVLVVSSAGVAREILKTHDVIFSERPKLTTIQRLLYERKDLLLAPYGEYWRQNRSIYVLQLLGNRRVEPFRSVRMEEVSLMVEKIREFSALSRPVKLSEISYGEGERSEKFKQLLREMLDILAAADIGDFLPWLGWVNRLSGFDAKVTRIAKGLDEFLEGVIKDRMYTPGGAEIEDNTQADFLDILLDACKDKLEGNSVGRDCIKALILVVSTYQSQFFRIAKIPL
ncbi:Psoralen synthase [Bertholletia excelsa]